MTDKIYDDEDTNNVTEKKPFFTWKKILIVLLLLSSIVFYFVIPKKTAVQEAQHLARGIKNQQQRRKFQSFIQKYALDINNFRSEKNDPTISIMDVLDNVASLKIDLFSSDFQNYQNFRKEFPDILQKYDSGMTKSRIRSVGYAYQKTIEDLIKYIKSTTNPNLQEAILTVDDAARRNLKSGSRTLGGNYLRAYKPLYQQALRRV
jgi:hypothetical protein